jgi:hypothetical protein
LLSGWGCYNVPMKRNRLTPLSNTNPRPTRQPPGAGEPSVWRQSLTPARCRQPSPTQGACPDPLSPPPIRGAVAGNICPFHGFFHPAEVITAARSSPASRHATQPFADSFGTPNPHTSALLLPRVSRPSGKSSGLHRASHG